MVSSVLLAHSSWASTDPGWISKREFLQRHASAHCLLNAAPISCHHSVKESMKSLSSPWRNLHSSSHHTYKLAPHAALSGLEGMFHSHGTLFPQGRSSHFHEASHFYNIWALFHNSKSEGGIVNWLPFLLRLPPGWNMASAKIFNVILKHKGVMDWCLMKVNNRPSRSHGLFHRKGPLE